MSYSILQLPLSVHDRVAMSLDSIHNIYREAKWYGPWNQVLQYHAFRVIDTAQISIFTSPQYTVDHFSMLNESEGDLDDEDMDDKDDEAKEDDDTLPFVEPSRGDVFQFPNMSLGQANLGSYVLAPPPTPLTSPFHVADALASPFATRRSGAPTPSTTAGMRNRLNHPGSTGSNDNVDGTPVDEAINPHTISSDDLQRSWRVPDFVQIALKRCSNGDKRVIIRMILLVENKPVPRGPLARRAIAHQFFKVALQSLKQARYTFTNPLHSQSKAKTIGAIIALGKMWTYIEHDKEAVEPSPTPSGKRDRTYVPTPSPGQSTSEDDDSPWELPALALKPYFGGKQWLELLDDEGESWIALEAVARRVKELNIDFWGIDGDDV